MRLKLNIQNVTCLICILIFMWKPLLFRQRNFNIYLGQLQLMLTEREQNFIRHIYFICNTVKHCNPRSQFEIKFAFVVWIYDLLQYINESLEYCSKIGNEIRMTKNKAYRYKSELPSCRCKWCNHKIPWRHCIPQQKWRYWRLCCRNLS